MLSCTIYCIFIIRPPFVICLPLFFPAAAVNLLVVVTVRWQIAVPRWLRLTKGLLMQSRAKVYQWSHGQRCIDGAAGKGVSLEPQKKVYRWS